jgi:SulP family sulfate permease
MGWLPKSVVCLRYYDYFRFRSDLTGGLILASHIFPAGIVIATASGVRPLYGIYCAAIAGFLASGLGDSKIRISAPSIVFVAVASSIVSREGVLGLSLSTLLAGIFLIFLATSGLGAAVPFIPRAIVVGFSTGIAALVVSGLLSDLLGVRSPISSNELRTIVTQHVAAISPHAAVMAIATLILIWACRKVSGLIPASLIAITMGAVLVKFHHLPVQTIGVSHGSALLLFHPFPAASLRLDLINGVLAQAFAIAILAAIQSLEAMGLAGSLTGERHNPKVELLVQGGANIACSMAGGLPASGVCAYTSANARGGAQTPIAGVLQAALLLVFLLPAAPFVQFIPLPVISAVLLSSVFDMDHWREMPQLVRLSRTDASAWFATSLLTIATDLSMAIAVGMLIGMFLCVQKRV